jgi:molecular chaperone HscB
MFGPNMGTGPNVSDAFDTLGVEPRFDLDLGLLEQRHRALAGTLHPDRYSGKPASERRMALGKAILVNEAWRLLCDPVRRAECLLSRAGVAVGELCEPKPSAELLMQMLELREELALAHKNRDPLALERLHKHLRELERTAVTTLEVGFVQAAGEREKLAALLPGLGKLRYIRRSLEELAAIEEDLMH